MTKIGNVFVFLGKDDESLEGARILHHSAALRISAAIRLFSFNVNNLLPVFLFFLNAS